MNNKLKSALVMLSLVASSAQSAPIPPVGAQELLCTALAQLAEYTAQGKAAGRSEKQARALATGVAGVEQSSLKVVAFVYASQLSPQDAKKIVFVNCLNRNFN